MTSPKNILNNYFEKIILSKYGSNLDPKSFEEKLGKIQHEFSENIQQNFESYLTPLQQQQLKNVIHNSPNQESALNFFMENIPNFESKLVQFILEFQQKSQV